MNDLEAFGVLVRNRRKIARLSQEALAAAAFGNANRKGYISTIENGLTKGLKPQTVQRLATALDISIREVPASLRWPVLGPEENEPIAFDPTVQAEMSALADRLHPLSRVVEKMERSATQRLSCRPIDTYKSTLSDALDALSSVYGQSFSFRSFAVSLTVAYAYIFFAGVLAYAYEGGHIGELEVFRRPDWARSMAQAFLALGIAAVVAVTGLVCYRWVRRRDIGIRPVWQAVIYKLIWRKRSMRILWGGGLLGCATVIASQLGVDPVVASIVVVIVGLMAIADLGPLRSGIAGALAGMLAGLIENLAAHSNIVGGLEGALFGFVLGGASFYVGALFSRSAATRVSGGLSGAGLGVCVGALATMAVFFVLDLVNADSARQSTEPDPAFDLLAVQDKTFVILAIIWVLFPLANAVQDYLSFGFSRALATFALRHETSLQQAAVLTLLDVMIAVALAVANIAGIFGVLWFADYLFDLDVSPHSFLSAWWSAPFAEGLWLSVMIISTLSWSVLHYVFVILPSISAHAASGRLFEQLRIRVVGEVAARQLSPESYALSFLPNLLYAFTYLLAITLSVFLAWQGWKLV